MRPLNAIENENRKKGYGGLLLRAILITFIDIDKPTQKSFNTPAHEMNGRYHFRNF